MSRRALAIAHGVCRDDLLGCFECPHYDDALFECMYNPPADPEPDRDDREHDPTDLDESKHDLSAYMSAAQRLEAIGRRAESEGFSAGKIAYNALLDLCIEKAVEFSLDSATAEQVADLAFEFAVDALGESLAEGITRDRGL